ncbi:MAG: restriction endonuclease, partial [Burkholderiales bacterium]|nr:restriction endonuclease [Burkholderiales bacterium]
IYTGHIKIKPQKVKEAKSKFEDWLLLGQDLDFSFLDFQEVENDREDPANVGALRLLLKELNQTAPAEGEKGRRFEILALAYFQSETKWKKQFRQVWLFADWAKEHPDLAGETYTKDIGIDLVAENLEDGKFAAIQCKFYKRGNKLDSKLLNTFLGASRRIHFTRRILVTTNKITTVQREKYRTYKPPIEIVDRWQLEHSEVQWNSLLNISFDQVGRNSPFSVKPEVSWKENLMDSVDKTSKKTCNYHKDIEPVLH